MPFDAVPADSGFISTSMAKTLMARMARTHERRRVSVFSGPPGIGKTTAIEEFQDSDPERVAVLSVPPGSGSGLKATGAIQLALEGLKELGGSPYYSDRVPVGHVELRAALYNVVCWIAGCDASRTRKRGMVDDRFRLTLVFDEAQNLSREAIELLRFANDINGGYSPFPLGLVFVGNNEFAMASDGRGQSVLSAAVADRALYTETFSYADVTNDDLALFLEARGLVDSAGLALVLSHFSAGREDRSFRRVSDLLDRFTDETDGGPITADAVRNVLGLTQEIL